MTFDFNLKVLTPKAVLTVLGCDYATSMEPLDACFLLVSMKGYMHLSDPMKRYVTTLDSHGNSLKENIQI